MHKRRMSAGFLGLAALGVLTGTSLQVAPASLAPPSPPGGGPLTWTADVQHWTGGGWDAGMQAAANHVADGFDDWRLPRVAELQAALQDGSWGQDADGGAGVFHHWTSKSQGIWAWAVIVSRDDAGVPIPAESGSAQKYLKTSNFYGAKFVRP